MTGGFGELGGHGNLSIMENLGLEFGKFGNTDALREDRGLESFMC